MWKLGKRVLKPLQQGAESGSADVWYSWWWGGRTSLEVGQFPWSRCAEITLLLYTAGNLIRHDLRCPASVLLSVVQSQVGEYPVKTDQSHCHWRILDSRVSGNCMRR